MNARLFILAVIWQSFLATTYLEREVEGRKVRVFRCLQNVALEVDVGHFVQLENLLFIDLF